MGLYILQLNKIFERIIEKCTEPFPFPDAFASCALTSRWLSWHAAKIFCAKVKRVSNKVDNCGRKWELVFPFTPSSLAAWESSVDVKLRKPAKDEHKKIDMPHDNEQKSGRMKWKSLSAFSSLLKFLPSLAVFKVNFLMTEVYNVRKGKEKESDAGLFLLQTVKKAAHWCLNTKYTESWISDLSTIKTFQVTSLICLEKSCRKW